MEELARKKDESKRHHHNLKKKEAYSLMAVNHSRSLVWLNQKGGIPHISMMCNLMKSIIKGVYRWIPKEKMREVKKYRSPFLEEKRSITKDKNKVLKVSHATRMNDGRVSTRRLMVLTRLATILKYS